MLIHSSKCNSHFLFFICPGCGNGASAGAMPDKANKEAEDRASPVAEHGNQRRRRVIFVAVSVFEIPSSIGAACFLMSLPMELGFVLGLKLQRFRACGAAAEMRRAEQKTSREGRRVGDLYYSGTATRRPSQNDATRAKMPPLARAVLVLMGFNMTKELTIYELRFTSQNSVDKMPKLLR